LAAARHPDGGRAVAACATPDFHPGDAGVAIGSVVETEGMVIPAAVGGDINCGMRLHAADVPIDRFAAVRDAFVDRLKGDYFLGTRDLPLRARTVHALFRHGLPGWLVEASRAPLGRLAGADMGQLMDETERVMLGGSMDGDPTWAPPDLVDATGVVRDGGLATIGGGNHFVEVQVVEEVVDRRRAWAWGLKAGQLAFMVHSGSRTVGKHIGGTWKRLARQAWPAERRFPRGDLFPLSLDRDPDLVRQWLSAQATAANYGFVNRALLAELLRLALRDVLGDVEAPLVADLPHNITLPEGRGWVTRKGACPAHTVQPVIIPGSMGTSSYVCVGKGSVPHLCSASHGAGRARRRFDMARRGSDTRDEALGLAGVDVVTLRPERRIEEAPAAYKAIGPVIDAQVAAGVVGVVARLRPVLTFKA